MQNVFDETFLTVNFIKSLVKMAGYSKPYLVTWTFYIVHFSSSNRRKWSFGWLKFNALFDMRNEIRNFMGENYFTLGKKLGEERSLTKLAYLADILLKS